MYLITAIGEDGAISEGRNELPAARQVAQNWLKLKHITDVTIWKRVAICELETKMVFKETNGTPMEPEIL